MWSRISAVLSQCSAVLVQAYVEDSALHTALGTVADVSDELQAEHSVSYLKCRLPFRLQKTLLLQIICIRCLHCHMLAYMPNTTWRGSSSIITPRLDTNTTFSSAGERIWRQSGRLWQDTCIMAAPFSTSPPPQQESAVPAPSIASTAEYRVENASISQHSPPCEPLSPATCPSPVSHQKSFATTDCALLMSISEHGASPSGFQEPPHDLSPSPHTMHDSSDQSLLSFPDATTLKDTLSAALPHASPPNACAQVSRAPRDHPQPTSIPPLEHASASSATVHAWQRGVHAWGSPGAPHSDQPDSDQPMGNLDALALVADAAAAAAEAETGALLRAENATLRQVQVGPIEDKVQCHLAKHTFPSAVAPPEPPALPWGYQSASTPDVMMSARRSDVTHGGKQRQQQLQQQHICPSRSPDSMACMRAAAPAASCMRASGTATCSSHPQIEFENMKETTRSGRSAAGVADTACLDGLSHPSEHSSAAAARCPSQPLRHIAAASDSKVQQNPSATRCPSQPQPPVAATMSHSEGLRHHSGANCPLQPLAHVGLALTPDSKTQQNPSATRSSPPQPLPQQTQKPAPTCQWQSEPAATCGAAAQAPPEAGLTHSECRPRTQGTRPQARSGILKKGCGGVSASRHHGGVRQSSHSRRVRFARLEGDDGHFDIEQHRREMSAAYALFSMARAV